MGSHRLDELQGSLVVSCQAAPSSPLNDALHIGALAQAAVLGGAKGVRIEGLANIAAVRASTNIPIIGLVKATRTDTDVYITPTVEDAMSIIAAGADIVAFDATSRIRPHKIEHICNAIHQAGRLVMADISTLEEGRGAMQSGADIVSTTMAGYTSYSQQIPGPDFDLMSELENAQVPFAAEGRIWTLEDARRCFEMGPKFIVIGTAITRPDAITRRFVEGAVPVPAANVRRSATP